MYIKNDEQTLTNLHADLIGIRMELTCSIEISHRHTQTHARTHISFHFITVHYRLLMILRNVDVVVVVVAAANFID